MDMLGQNGLDDHHRKVVCISQDSFYRDLDPICKARAVRGMHNFDHPDAFDERGMYEAVVEIMNRRPCKIPVYDYVNNCRKPGEFQVINNADVVLVEGILVFYFPEIRELFDMKLFVDTDADTRLSRRVLRDTQDRGRDLSVVLRQYISLVKPAFEEFCLPTKKHADVIIPRGAENLVAIDLIVKHIQDILRARIEGRRLSTSASPSNAILGSPTASNTPVPTPSANIMTVRSRHCSETGIRTVH